MTLTTHFTLEQLLRSDTAVRLGFEEQFNPTQDVIDNLGELARNILEPLQQEIMVTLNLTSVYRCKRLNEAIGGSPNSDHVRGMASDTELFNHGEEQNLFLFQEFLKLELPFKQALCEYGTLQQFRWLHISYDKNNIKNQILQATKVNGKTVYLPLPREEVLAA